MLFVACILRLFCIFSLSLFVVPSNVLLSLASWLEMLHLVVALMCPLISLSFFIPSFLPPTSFQKLTKERELRGKIEDLRTQLAPLEAQCRQIASKSDSRTNWAVWGCMAYMSMQSGFFARLTFVDYSWDIMEPITYFVTYGTSMACFAYFILTKQASTA